METCPLPSLTAATPAEPHVDQKARIAAAVDAARDEILDLSHRIHADPEPAFEEHRAAAAVAEALARHGFEVEFPAGSLATAIRAVRPRRARRRRPADRDPRRVRRAPRARARLWPQHDGGLGGRRRDRARRDGRRAARRDRLPRHAGRRAGERQGDHDRRRALRRPRRRADVPPVRPQPRRELAAGVGGRRRGLPRPAGARLVGPVEGPERARRDDPAVQLGRALAPAAASRPPASTGSSARAAPPRTSSRSGPPPGS